MSELRNEKDEEYESIFIRMEQGANAAVLRQSAQIFEQSGAIRELAEITRQVDLPYIGSYLSA
ncbi:hypothetical protein BH09GEM1_BH09GEM1_24710 [soil metagenome]